MIYSNILHIDGSGKSTQIKLLEEKFILSNLNYKFFREPGGNFLSEEIRNILLNKKLNICDISETMLFLASRAQLTHEKIKPALDKNNFDHVRKIMNRYSVYDHKLTTVTTKPKAAVTR